MNHHYDLEATSFMSIKALLPSRTTACCADGGAHTYDVQACCRQHTRVDQPHHRLPVFSPHLQPSSIRCDHGLARISVTGIMTTRFRISMESRPHAHRSPLRHSLCPTCSWAHQPTSCRCCCCCGGGGGGIVSSFHVPSPGQIGPCPLPKATLLSPSGLTCQLHLTDTP